MVHLVINTLIDKNTILDCDIYFQIEKAGEINNK